MKHCINCGKDISNRGNSASRCVLCQKKMDKILLNIRNKRRLGSPKLYRKKKNGRLVSETYGCGVNIHNQFPLKKARWMNFNPIGPTDAEQEQRNIASISDNTINTYNVIQGKRLRKEIYKGWKYTSI